VNERFDDILRWASERNILEGSTPQAQMLKLVEEVGELAHGVARGNWDAVYDAIGDTVVVLTILAKMHHASLDYCLNQAWLQIRDRKGRMVDGIFVKEEEDGC
jgi:hypothetical protein